jgi:hypothetical protein
MLTFINNADSIIKQIGEQRNIPQDVRAIILTYWVFDTLLIKDLNKIVSKKHNITSIIKNLKQKFVYYEPTSHINISKYGVYHISIEIIKNDPFQMQYVVCKKCGNYVNTYSDYSMYCKCKNV